MRPAVALLRAISVRADAVHSEAGQLAGGGVGLYVAVVVGGENHGVPLFRRLGCMLDCLSRDDN